METKTPVVLIRRGGSESSVLSVKIGRSRNKFGMTNFYGFTLVELIVVITILVILGTIAFINLGGYSSSARDSTRIENLANLKKGLDVYQAKNGGYPLPEGPLNILASGSIIGYQGFAKDQVAGMANLSVGGTKDPSDASIYTTYSVSTNQSKMQVMAFLEDGSNATAFAPLLVPTASAGASSDYSARTPTTQGYTLGILLSTASGNLNQPLQEALSVSFTGIDVVAFTGNLSDGTPVSLKAQLSNTESIAGTGGELIALESNMNTKMRLVMCSCPTTGGWKDLGILNAGVFSSCTNNWSDYSARCHLCETDNNSLLPKGSLILTNTGGSYGPNIINTWWPHNQWASHFSCYPWTTVVCYMGLSLVDTSFPTGFITIMQSCPSSWKDLWTSWWGAPSLVCPYGKRCRICQKQ